VVAGDDVDACWSAGCCKHESASFSPIATRKEYEHVIEKKLAVPGESSPMSEIELVSVG
jgi:hypothetical protein